MPEYVVRSLCLLFPKINRNAILYERVDMNMHHSYERVYQFPYQIENNFINLYELMDMLNEVRSSIVSKSQSPITVF